MIKTEVINENKDFKRLYYRGKTVGSPFVVLYYMPQKNVRDKNLLGITVSTKVGKAVVRNRVRRWIKEAYRSFEPDLRPGFSMVILARKAASESDYWTIRKVLGGMLKKADMFALDK